LGASGALPAVESADSTASDEPLSGSSSGRLQYRVW